MTTPPTTSCKRGDVVFVPFLFADQPVAKNRPAVVISTDEYHRKRADVIVAAITGQIREPLLPGDHLLTDWEAAGLIKPSVVKATIRTVKGTMVRRILGRMPAKDLNAFDRGLARVIGLSARAT